MAGQETRRRDDFSRPVLIVRCDKIDYSRSFLAPGKNEKKMKWRRPTIRSNGTKKPFTRLSSVARIAVTRAIYCITDEKFHRVYGAVACLNPFNGHPLSFKSLTGNGVYGL